MLSPPITRGIHLGIRNVIQNSITYTYVAQLVLIESPSIVLNYTQKYKGVYTLSGNQPQFLDGP